MEQRLGNYHLKGLLGSGGFANVYYGEHLYLKTPAAIKVLRVQITGNEHEKFLAEARIAARLEHPHIVSVLEFGIEQTTPYLVMDYAANGTLRQQYPKGTQLNPTQILPVVKHIASALHYTHEQHLIHRDVKPENMLLNSKHETLLSDFGIALVVQNIQHSDTQEHVVGTIAYMAPEQLRGEPSPASDQYSLGAVIYEWLCGEPPFSGSYTEMAIQHALVPPISLRKRVPHLSPEVEEVIMIALAKEPQARFKSIEAFATTFTQACAAAQYTETIEKRNDPHLQQKEIEAINTKKHYSRRKFAVGLSLLGGTGLIAGGTVAGKFLLQRSQTPPPVKQPTQSPHLTPTATTSGPGTTLYTYHGHPFVGNIAWSPESKRIASASDNVQIWDATSGKLILTHYHEPYQRYGIGVTMAWSPNGKWITSMYFDGQLQVWDANTGDTLYTYHHKNEAGEYGPLAWSPESQCIASTVTNYGVPAPVQIWKATTGELLTTYSGHTAAITSLAWSPDGKYIASAQKKIHVENTGGTVHIWDTVSGDNLLIYRKHTDNVNAVAWSSNGKYLVSAGGTLYDNSGKNDHTVQIWEAVSGKTLLIYSEHTGAVATAVWSPDGKYIASGDAYHSGASVKIWDASTGQTLLTYSGHTHGGHMDGVVSLAWSPDGKLIASGGADGTVQVWKAV